MDKVNFDNPFDVLRLFSDPYSWDVWINPDTGEASSYEWKLNCNPMEVAQHALIELRNLAEMERHNDV